MKQLSMFDQYTTEASSLTVPLADRMRPQSLEEYVGQTHLCGRGMLLRRILEQD